MCKFLGCKKHRYYRYFLYYLHILHILHIVEHRFYARARTHTRVKGCCTKLCANAQVVKKVPINRGFPCLHILHIGRKNGKFRVGLVRSVFVLAVLRWVTPSPFNGSIGCPGAPVPVRFRADVAARSDPIVGDASVICANCGREKNLKKCTKTLHLCIDKDTFM